MDINGAFLLFDQQLSSSTAGVLLEIQRKKPDFKSLPHIVESILDRVALNSKNAQKRLQTILVIPMGTKS